MGSYQKILENIPCEDRTKEYNLKVKNKNCKGKVYILSTKIVNENTSIITKCSICDQSVKEWSII